MFPKQQLLMMIALYGSLAAGFFIPGPSAALAPYIKYFMIFVLFLAFIKISPSDVATAVRQNPGMLAVWSITKLFLFPIAVWALALVFQPKLALPLMMLSASSTAVAAPLFISVVGGNISACMVMSVVSSLALPLTMPLLVEMASDVKLTMDVADMAGFLATIIFIPLALVFLGQKTVPGLLQKIIKRGFPISLAAMCLLCYAVLGRFADYLKNNADAVLICMAAGFALSVLAWIAGWLPALGKPKKTQLASMGSMVWLNQVITLALGVEMDWPLLAVISAMYCLPLFLSIPVFARFGAAKPQPAPLRIKHAYRISCDKTRR